jgi:hypothetical protein
MAVTDLTTVARIKVLDSAYSNGAKDTLLGQVITSVSARVERYLDRHILSTSRTEKFNLTSFGCIFEVKGYPVSAVTAVDNDGTSITLSDVIYDDNSVGRISINDNVLTAGFGRLSITYTGGMATDTSDFISNYPDIAHEIDMQVLFEIGKSKNLVEKRANIDNQTSEKYDLDLLPSLKRILKRYKKKTWIM